MGSLIITFEGISHNFASDRGRPITVGRSPDNDLVVADPTVSRHHAQVEWDGAWTWVSLGNGRTLSAAQPVTRLRLESKTALQLAGPQGPTLHIEAIGAATMPAPPSPTGPGRGDVLSALEILIPVKSWLHNPGWRQRMRLAVIPYALLPILFIVIYRNSENLTTPGWAYSLYIAPLWAFAFWLLIRPGPLGRLHLRLGVGIIAWVLIWMKVVTVNVNDHLVSWGQVQEGQEIVRYVKPFSLPAALAVGFNEEITKALPILLAALLLLKWRNEKLSLRMWMFLGTIAGLTFGVAEQAGYTSQALVQIADAQTNNEAIIQVLQFAERVFVDGFQHAIWAGISAFFIGMAVNYPRRRVELVAFAVAVPAVLHGLNDWLSGHDWLWVGVQTVSLLLFLGYTMSAGSIERDVRRAPMFRGESILADDQPASSATGPLPWGPVLAPDLKPRRWRRQG